MHEFILANKERKEIFKIMCENKELTFNQIKEKSGLLSNKLSYQLNIMKDEGILKNEDKLYSLTIEAQSIIPYFSQIHKKEIGVLPVVLGIVKNNKNQILLLKRKKMPYKDMWGVIGGKQINGETIPETIEREVYEESKVEAKFEQTNALIYERLREENRFKNSFLLILTTLKSDCETCTTQTEGEVAWFDFQEVLDGKVKDIIPSDLIFIQKYSKESIKIHNVIMDEDKQENNGLSIGNDF